MVRETRIDLGRLFGSVGTRLWFGSGASGLGKFEKIGKVTDPVGWFKGFEPRGGEAWRHECCFGRSL